MKRKLVSYQRFIISVLEIDEFFSLLAFYRDFFPLSRFSSAGILGLKVVAYYKSHCG